MAADDGGAFQEYLRGLTAADDDDGPTRQQTPQSSSQIIRLAMMCLGDAREFVGLARGFVGGDGDDDWDETRVPCWEAAYIRLKRLQCVAREAPVRCARFTQEEQVELAKAVCSGNTLMEYTLEGLCRIWYNRGGTKRSAAVAVGGGGGGAPVPPPPPPPPLFFRQESRGTHEAHQQAVRRRSAENPFEIPDVDGIALVLQAIAEANRHGRITAEEKGALKQMVINDSHAAAMALLTNMLEETQPPEDAECSICLMESPYHENLTCEGCNASVCLHTCAVHWANTAIRDKNPLTCPMQCGRAELFTPDELRVMLTQAAALRRSSDDEPADPISAAEIDALVARYTDDQAGRTIDAMPGRLQCPFPGCGNVMDASNFGGNAKCSCAACGQDFCVFCKKPFHYNVDCGAVAAVEQRWADWCENHREQLLRRMASDQRDFAAALQNFETNRKQHEERAADARRAMDNLRADQTWMEANCRACPRCGRPVNKTGGCDAMKCGTNYHGGNTQNGCGHSFNWNRAAPYRAGTTDASHLTTVTDFADVRPEEIREQQHELVPGVQLPCDICNEPIVGPKFTCIHCPGQFTVCLKCESQLEGRGPPQHAMTHAFLIHFDEQNDRGRRRGGSEDPDAAPASAVRRAAEAPPPAAGDDEEQQGYMGRLFTALLWGRK